MSETTPGETVAKVDNATVSIEPDHEEVDADSPEGDPEDKQQDEIQALPLAPAAHASTTADDDHDVEGLENTGETVGSPEDYYFGPVGKRRNPAAVLFLCVITFGLYGLVWHNRNNREIGDFDPQMHVHAGRSTWAVVIPWVLGLLVTLAGAARIGLSAAGVSLPFNPGFSVHEGYFLLAGLLAVPYFTLLLPFSITAVVMTAERIRILEERVGLTTDVQIRPSTVGALLVIPLAGPMLLIGSQQRRINAAWQRVDPSPERKR